MRSARQSNRRQMLCNPSHRQTPSGRLIWMPKQKRTYHDTECRDYRSLDSHRRRSRFDRACCARQGWRLGLYWHRAAGNRTVPVLSSLSPHRIDDLSTGIEKNIEERGVVIRISRIRGGRPFGHIENSNSAAVVWHWNGDADVVG